MPSNIEIKAHVSDFPRACALAEALSGAPPAFIPQCDTFFPCVHGRLKLRKLSDALGQLIAYSRPDTTAAKLSNYLIFPTDSPDRLHATLSAALGRATVVKKLRRLYLVGQTRIHLDEVENLGTFLELEVVLEPGQPAEDGHAIAAQIMQQLEVRSDQLIAGAYADLLDARSSATDPSPV